MRQIIKMETPKKSCEPSPIPPPAPKRQKVYKIYDLDNVPALEFPEEPTVEAEVLDCCACLMTPAHVLAESNPLTLIELQQYFVVKERYAKAMAQLINRRLRSVTDSFISFENI